MKTISLLASCVAFALLAVASVHAQTVTGSGTAGTIPIWTSSSHLGNSIISQSGAAVTIRGGVIGQVSDNGIAVEGTSTNGAGVYGRSTGDGAGVSGLSSTGIGVQGQSSSGGFGVLGISNSSTGVAVIGYNTNGVGGAFESGGNGQGVYGASMSGTGVSGSSSSSYGVYGSSTSGDAVKGLSGNQGGVVGESTSGDGTVGVSCSSSCGAAAIVGTGHLAGAFSGEVGIVGDLSVTGLKAFHIDHPLDPANKYLNHFAIESNEGLDTYSGNVTTDGRGTAIVELPDYFEALNTNYRYQLTVIGQFAQAIILQEIQNNRFVIRTDKPSVKVSWQVTGVRSDAYVKVHPMPVEEEKPEQERGYYLAPELFGQPEERSIIWLYHGHVMREAKALEQKRQEQGAAKALGQKLEQELAATAPRWGSGLGTFY